MSVVERRDGDALGTWVVTAFEVDDDGVVPVVRGWLAAGEDTPAPPTGELDLVGSLEPTEPDALRDPGRDVLPQGQVEIISSAELISLWQPPLYQGFVIQQDPTPTSPLQQVDSPARSVQVVTNWQNAAYGVQWWLFGMFAVFWFARMVRVEAEDRREEPGERADHQVGTMDDEQEGRP